MDSNIVIQIDKVSKQYRLGEVSTGSMHHDINRWWYRMRGKEDPYLSITGENIRTRRRERKTAHSTLLRNSASSAVFEPSACEEYVWALKDITFEVREGEVLGIIGRNGAGKSTLLKILSRVTAPTLGEIRVKGRIASLLEVGTGFHQDLTGRENIYLNGAVLGMTRQEISCKLDEIVEFSGCAAYLDTPVKRYSSGMVVRLGFAVAAHLEPEILIVDEVLAVGDFAFQAKCIGKMSEVAAGGRTVLFVSHNMESIRTLTSRCVALENGIILCDTSTEEAVQAYLGEHDPERLIGLPVPLAEIECEQHVFLDPLVSFVSLGLGPGGRSDIPSGGDLILHIEVEASTPCKRLCVGYVVRHDSAQIAIAGFSPAFSIDRPGRYVLILTIRKLDLAPGHYDMHLGLNRGGPSEVKQPCDILMGVARFKTTWRRVGGGVIPEWKSSWGCAMHTEASILCT